MRQSPRQLLLARHAAAAPELNSIRRTVLPESRLSGGEFLRELFVPSRRIWAALAAVWIAMFLFNAAQPPRSRPTLPAVQLLAAWSNPQAQLDALLAETRTLP